MTLWGRLRIPSHVIHVARLDRAARVIESRERDPHVRRWDHRLMVEPHPAGALRTDRATLEAGWRTPAVARLCRHIYAHRPRRRGALDIRRRIEAG